MAEGKPKLHLHTCRICEWATLNPEELEEHNQNEHFPCTKCKKVFSTVEELDRHSDSEHPSTSQDNTGDMDAQLPIAQSGTGNPGTQFPIIPQSTSQVSSNELDTVFTTVQLRISQGSIGDMDAQLSSEQSIQQGGMPLPIEQLGRSHDNPGTLFPSEHPGRFHNRNANLDAQSHSGQPSTPRGKGKKLKMKIVHEGCEFLSMSFLCEVCNTFFSTKVDLEEHMKNHQGANDSQDFHLPVEHLVRSQGSNDNFEPNCPSEQSSISRGNKTQDKLNAKPQIMLDKYQECHDCNKYFATKSDFSHHLPCVRRNMGSRSHTVTRASLGYDDTMENVSSLPSTSTAGNASPMDTGATSPSGSQIESFFTSTAGNTNLMDRDATSPSVRQKESSLICTADNTSSMDIDVTARSGCQNQSCSTADNTTSMDTGVISPISSSRNESSASDRNYEADYASETSSIASCGLPAPMESNVDGDKSCSGTEASNPVSDDILDTTLTGDTERNETETGDTGRNESEAGDTGRNKTGDTGRNETGNTGRNETETGDTGRNETEAGDTGRNETGDTGRNETETGDTGSNETEPGYTERNETETGDNQSGGDCQELTAEPDLFQCNICNLMFNNRDKYCHHMEQCQASSSDNQSGGECQEPTAEPGFFQCNTCNAMFNSRDIYCHHMDQCHASSSDNM